MEDGNTDLYSLRHFYSNHGRWPSKRFRNSVWTKSHRVPRLYLIARRASGWLETPKIWKSDIPRIAWLFGARSYCNKNGSVLCWFLRRIYSCIIYQFEWECAQHCGSIQFSQRENPIGIGIVFWAFEPLWFYYIKEWGQSSWAWKDYSLRGT